MRSFTIECRDFRTSSHTEVVKEFFVPTLERKCWAKARVSFDVLLIINDMIPEICSLLHLSGAYGSVLQHMLQHAAMCSSVLYVFCSIYVTQAFIM